MSDIRSNAYIKQITAIDENTDESDVILEVNSIYCYRNTGKRYLHRKNTN